MLGRHKFQGGIKNGELYVSAGETYIGGSPAAINTSGELALCKASTAADYVGVFANSNTVDGVTAAAKAKGTYYAGLNVLTLEAESDGTYPYDTVQTWNEGDQLNIDSNGKWTNQATGSQTYYGTVIEAASTYLIVQFIR